ncbi:hypothetical protein PVAP13_5NG067362 [Panicum virgatum]|uniref:Uncharacterized protein n=1 Tax=Panicum virgatum TaxID=38727 RepID=A0A8T0RPF4_PANVG|nr:hypothetical protein PVAP13_5NG067362 [Panicum virgatum]
MAPLYSTLLVIVPFVMSMLSPTVPFVMSMLSPTPLFEYLERKKDLAASSHGKGEAEARWQQTALLLPLCLARLMTASVIDNYLFFEIKLYCYLLLVIILAH